MHVFAQPCLTMLLAAGLLASICGFPQRVHAGDWPQILGPNRTGIAANETLLEKWPAGGPTRLWQVKLGEGYAGVAVVKNRVVVFHRVGDREMVECLAADSGRRLWNASFTATYRGGINPDSGPRSTPVIAGENVVVYGANGDLHCLELATGKKLWSRELSVDYEAPEGYFGVGSSPLVVGEVVVVNVGSREGAALVGLSLSEGKTLWTAYDDTASYSSPTLVRWGDTTAVIALTRLNCVALDPADGHIHFEFPFGQRGPTVNAAVPLVVGTNRLFLSASYGIGARWLEIGPQSAKTLWSNDSSLSSQYTTAVYHNNMLYGTHGREDIGTAALRAVHAATGKVAWEVADFGVAHAISAGDKLLFIKNNGQVVLAQANPNAFEPLASAQVAEASVRAVPALSSGRLFIRSTTPAGGALTCVQVGEIK